jgi:TolA-binding protein/HEAT repeat protein
MTIEERAMKWKTTLAITTVSLLAVGAVGAQTPQPVPPAPAAEPAPWPKDIKELKAPKPPKEKLGPDDPYWESEKARMKRDELRLLDDDMRAREKMRMDEERMRENEARVMEKMRVDEERTREAQGRALEKMKWDEWQSDLDGKRKMKYEIALAPTPALPALPPMPAMPPMVETPGVPDGFGDIDGRFLGQRPRESWLQGDPADSLYNAAREALNRGEYRRAADLFAQVTRRYPNSGYAPTSGYWEAFSRYRIGTTEELRLASQALDAATARYSQISREADVPGLRTRIDGVLASRGDVVAERRVRERARGTSSGDSGDAPCDKEDIQVRAEALSALAQMDPNGALPTLRRVLDRSDECSVQLRRSAAMMLARRADSASARILANVAQNDASMDVRVEAIQWLPRMPGTMGLTALEDILRNSDDERVQRAAVGALMSSDNPRARSSVRAILERRDASERLRMEALSRYDHEHSTPDDAAFLKSLYARTDSERIKESLINAIARIGGSDDFLMGIVRNEAEPYSMRAAALSRLSRSGTMSIADLSKLYDAADARSMREQIINALAGRKESEATDKLVDIAKSSTDYNARRMAIAALTRRNDPRARDLLKELIEK